MGLAAAITVSDQANLPVEFALVYGAYALQTFEEANLQMLVSSFHTNSRLGALTKLAKILKINSSTRFFKI